MGTVFVDNLEPQSGTSLTLGASGDTLQAASGTTNLLSNVVQFKSAQARVGITTSSTSAVIVSTDLNITITPKSATNKILIRYFMGWYDSLGNGRDIKATIYRDSTNLLSDAGANDNWYRWDSYRNQGSWTVQWLDSTYNSTSAITYKLYGWSGGVGEITVGSTGKFSLGEVYEIQT